MKHTFLICMIVLFGIFTGCFNSTIRDWSLFMKRGGGRKIGGQGCLKLAKMGGYCLFLVQR